MKLMDSDLLVGETETITAMDLRRGPGDILTQVAMGKTFLITKNGKPIATLTRPEEQQGLYVVSELRRRGIVKKFQKSSSSSISSRSPSAKCTPDQPG